MSNSDPIKSLQQKLELANELSRLKQELRQSLLEGEYNGDEEVKRLKLLASTAEAYQCLSIDSLQRSLSDLIEQECQNGGRGCPKTPTTQTSQE